MLNAALTPAKTNYIFFVSDAQGHSRFAASLKEHNQNVHAYRKAGLQANDSALVRSLVAQGVGAAIVPRSSLACPGPSVALRRFSPALQMAVVLWWRRDGLSLAARAFVEFAAAHGTTAGR